MKNYLYICMCSLLLIMGAGGVQAKDGQFFETLYDIPVMEGIEEIPEMALSFDKVGGRIAEAGAIASELTESEIITFYKASLEQMGWMAHTFNQSPYIFTREGEKLSIFIDKSKASPVIRFLLQPISDVKR